MRIFDPKKFNSLDVYASNGPGSGSAVSQAGIYSQRQNKAFILDTANNVIRTFLKGENGGGGRIFASGVSAPGISFETAELVEIGLPITVTAESDLEIKGIELFFLNNWRGGVNFFATPSFQGGLLQVKICGLSPRKSKRF